jgi:hypothetical protein
MRRRILLVLGAGRRLRGLDDNACVRCRPEPRLEPGRAGLSSGDFRYLALPASRTTEVQVVSMSRGTCCDR